MKFLYKILILGCFGQYFANAQKVQTITSKSWNVSTWQNNALFTYNYDPNFYNTGMLDQLWNPSTSTYTNWISYTYTNNAVGSLSLSLTQLWNTAVNTWSNLTLSTSYYNSANNATLQLNQNWNGLSWQNGSQVMQSYTNNYLTNFTVQSWNSATSTYTNNYMLSYTNNANGNPVSSLFQIWNSTGNTWTNSSLTSYAYNAINNVTLQISQGWNGSSWQNSSQMLKTYDASNFLIGSATQYWSSSSSTYTNGTNITYTNDPNGNPLTVLYQYWVSASSTWSNSSLQLYTYLNTPPTVSTSANATGITYTTADCSGTVTANGGANVTARGICWSTSSNPSISNQTVTSGNGNGSYSVTLTGLTANTVYYARAFATNSVGISYGAQITFTTDATLSPTVVTSAFVMNIGSISADCSGTVTADGGANVTTRGICWNTNPGPSTSNQTASSGSGTGSYTVTMSGLSANTGYYARAFATNSVGTSYGAQISFTTNSAAPSVVTDATMTNVGDVMADCGGNVTFDGGITITNRGICWSMSPGPGISDQVVAAGTGIGSFTVTLTGLTPNTMYYARAFATNSVGTSYGSDLSFTTAEAAGLKDPGNSSILQRIEAYPSPAGDYVNLKCGASLSGVQYVLYTTSGQAMLSGTLDKDKKRIEMAQLPAGLYILKTAYGSVKIIKE